MDIERLSFSSEIMDLSECRAKIKPISDLDFLSVANKEEETSRGRG